jgi:hypothetical protein
MSLVDVAGGGLDGLSQLRGLIASGRKPGFLVAQSKLAGPLQSDWPRVYFHPSNSSHSLNTTTILASKR